MDHVQHVDYVAHVAHTLMLIEMVRLVLIEMVRLCIVCCVRLDILPCDIGICCMWQTWLQAVRVNDNVIVSDVDV